MSTAVQSQSCKMRISNAFSSRIHDVSRLWKAYQAGEDSELYKQTAPELGDFNDYGLSFDYVAPNTFKDQRRGYFRYQISWGGPSEEFRFFCDENRNVVRVEFWYLDWFDGAKKILAGDNFSLMVEIFDFLKETGTVDHVYRDAMED